MSSLSSMLVDQLESYGLPLQYASKVTGLFTGDIISLVFRLVCVSLLASIVKGWFYHWKNALHVALFPTAHISDDLRTWTASYLAQDPDAQRQLRHYRLKVDKTSEYSIAKKDKKNKHVMKNTFVEDGFCGRILPIDGQTVRITVNGKWMWLTKYATGFAGPRGGPHYRLTTWFWNHKQIRAYAVMVHKIHTEKTSTLLNIYNHTPHVANWESPVSRPSRPWSSVILPGTVKEDLLKDVKDFISEEETAWYTSKGIPHRRGYLLHGPPGTGKTTLSLASTLQLDLYCINPAAMGKLQKCFRNCPPGSMILIEDIDCVMPINRATYHGSDNSSDDGKADTTPNEAAVGKKDLGPSTVTLSGLLNAIDGVSSQEDSVLFASTNFPDKLDEALRRPGRFDVHIAFNHAVTEQAIDLYKHFYPLSRIHVDLPSDTAEEKKSQEKSTSHPFNDQDDLDRAAEQFAEHIMGKNIKVSIATIQGFLLLYKKDPVMALDKVDEWAEGIRKEQFPNAENKVAEHDVVDKGSGKEETAQQEEVQVEEQKAEEQNVKKPESEKQEIAQQEEVKVGERKAEEHEVEKQESEKQEIMIEQPEKQEAVQEVVLA